MGPRPSRLAAASPPPPPVVPPPPPPPPAQAERERARTPAAATGSRYLRVFIQVLLAEYRLDRWCSWCGDHHTSDPAVRNASVYIKALRNGNRTGPGIRCLSPGPAAAVWGLGPAFRVGQMFPKNTAGLTAAARLRSAHPLGAAEPGPCAGPDMDQHGRALADDGVQRLHEGRDLCGQDVRCYALARLHPDPEGRLALEFIGGHRGAGQVRTVGQRGPERLFRHAAADPDAAGHLAGVVRGHEQVRPSFALLRQPRHHDTDHRQQQDHHDKPQPAFGPAGEPGLVEQSADAGPHFGGPALPPASDRGHGGEQDQQRPDNQEFGAQDADQDPVQDSWSAVHAPITPEAARLTRTSGMGDGAMARSSASTAARTSASRSGTPEAGRTRRASAEAITSSSTTTAARGSASTCRARRPGSTALRKKKSPAAKTTAPVTPSSSGATPAGRAVTRSAAVCGSINHGGSPTARTAVTSRA